jgi:hydroxymethylpyrimidine/phosphomethylpyrimidine kinase
MKSKKNNLPLLNKMQPITHKVLIIAGSDSCGGAGVQADLKTATSLKTYAASAITCLTAQSSARVYNVFYPPIDFLKQQIEVVLDDMSFDCIKIGMVGNAKIINLVAEILAKKAKNIKIVLDTVMVATSGDLLMEESAISILKSKLINQAYLVTPNIIEAKILSQIKIAKVSDMKKAAKIIKQLGCKNVLIKGGHLLSGNNIIKNLLLGEDEKFHLITNKKLGKDYKNQNIHGTGCTLASAIACNLAKKIDLLSAVRKANGYVYRSIVKSADIGKGSRILINY